MAKNFPNLKKQISRFRNHRVPNKMNPKRPTPRYVTIKMAKVKDNSKGSKRKRHTHKLPQKAIS